MTRGKELWADRTELAKTRSLKYMTGLRNKNRGCGRVTGVWEPPGAHAV